MEPARRWFADTDHQGENQQEEAKEAEEKSMKKLFHILLVVLLPLMAQAEAKKRPNILFIIADDQSPFDFKTYNPVSALDSPVLDKLAAEGMVFDAAYHKGSMSGAVYSPSRRMIMSGRTVWHLQGTGKKKEKGWQAKEGGGPGRCSPS